MSTLHHGTSASSKLGEAEMILYLAGWGQHDTVEVVKYAQSLDSSRIFDGASGWVDHDVS